MASRRTFLAGALAFAAAPSWAQDKPRVYRIGVLDAVPPAQNAANLALFQKAMRDLGYTEGRNLTTLYRSSDGHAEGLPRLAAQLAGEGVDIFVARTTPAALAAMNVRGEIPVIAASVADPVETKLVQSLEKPGGKVTGAAFLVNDLEARRVDVLRAVAPGRKRIIAMMNMSNPAIAATWKLTADAAKAIGLEADLVDVRRPDEIGGGFTAALAKGAQALVVRLGSLADTHNREVADLAARHKLPAVYASRQYVDAGGLMSYGVSASAAYTRAATFVDKVLKGARPATLPMEKITRFELIINRKAMHALGLTLPPDLLLKSDEIVG